MEGLPVRRKSQPFRIVDCRLFARMVMNLGYDPMRCLHVISLWKWLEAEFGYPNIIATLLRDTPNSSVITLVNEAVNCINWFLEETPPPRSTSLTITTTEFRGTQVRISLRALYQYRESALRRIAETVDIVIFIRAAEQLAALITLLRPMGQTHDAVAAAVATGLVPVQVQESMIDPNLNRIINQVPLEEHRTMMITFYRENPITERELQYFFDRYIIT
ncbi:hypothetical protein BVC80_1835g581 [Macleaya cordata]|uniref:Uncharacterized protein n=1 Tax=Macleaya cordata TaxID=56857 RepID=A0A200R605_MACCD|nr:hypothetical protein BVC80_1835g581 [Macleaya cordata]